MFSRERDQFVIGPHAAFQKVKEKQAGPGKKKKKSIEAIKFATQKRSHKDDMNTHTDCTVFFSFTSVQQPMYYHNSEERLLGSFVPSLDGPSVL